MYNMDPVFATKRKIFLISNEFWKTKRDRSLTFGILTNNEWVKYAHKIIWQHYAPIASYGSFRNWLLDVELLLKNYTFHCKILCFSYVNIKKCQISILLKKRDLFCYIGALFWKKIYSNEEIQQNDFFQK